MVKLTEFQISLINQILDSHGIKSNKVYVDLENRTLEFEKLITNPVRNLFEEKPVLPIALSNPGKWGNWLFAKGKIFKRSMNNTEAYLILKFVELEDEIYAIIYAKMGNETIAGVIGTDDDLSLVDLKYETAKRLREIEMFVTTSDELMNRWEEGNIHLLPNVDTISKFTK